MLHVPVGAGTFGLVQPSTTARPAAAQGTVVTPAVGSKGAWAQVIASTTDDSFGLLICVNSSSTSAASRNIVLDIGLGASGAELVLVPDLIAGNANTYGAGGVWYFFPVFVPAGSRVSARAQGTVATTFNVFLQLQQRLANPANYRKASFVEAVGMATLPQGTATPSGTTAKGAWALLGTTTRRLWWWQLGVQVSSADTTHSTASYHLDVAVGDATNKDIIIQDAQFLTTTNESASTPPLSIGLEFPVEAGSSIYVRAQCSATPDAFFCCAYGAGG